MSGAQHELVEPAQGLRPNPGVVWPIRWQPVEPTALRAPPPCASCHLWNLCQPCPAPGHDEPVHDGAVFARRRVAAGQMLYSQGEPFHFIYAVRSGSLKSTTSARDGRDRVCGFHVAGDVLALDGVAAEHHASSAMALDDVQVCAVGYRELRAELALAPGLQRSVSRLLGREIVRGHALMLLMGRMNARERLAAFVLDLSVRMGSHDNPARELRLCMTRADIGSLLGLTLETVSRTFSQLQHERHLRVDQRHIGILDPGEFARAFSGLQHGSTGPLGRREPAPPPRAQTEA